MTCNCLLLPIQSAETHLGGPGEAHPRIAYPPGAGEDLMLCMDTAYLIYLIDLIACDNPSCKADARDKYEANVANCISQHPPAE